MPRPLRFPVTITTLRNTVVAAVDTAGAQPCTTTLLAWRLGPAVDPAEKRKALRHEPPVLLEWLVLLLPSARLIEQVLVQ